MRARVLLAVVSALMWGCSPGGAPAGPPTYVGSQRCASCHEGEAHSWRTSQHARAMQEPTAETVLGRFSGSFTYAGVTTTFSQRAGGYWVRTDGPDGRLHDYKVRYVFGVEPLQQYLLETEEGRLQALSVAWDCRAKRWYHLYPGQGIKAGDALHWTGRGQNWNHMCADCHSTDVHKNYEGGRYRTTFSELSVGCEACHGPGSQHAAQGLGPLPADLTPPADHRFARGQLAPVDPTYTERQAQVCARCHSRRHQLRAGWTPDQPLLDAYVPSDLEEDVYYVDGQQKDEVYTYGSFVQSRMYRAGVACTDCHEPHSMKLRASGDALCLSCHTADSHSHHQQSVSCVDCHAPTRTYMGVDPRHDHSFRVPRPDLSQRLGTPDACTMCHKERDAGWAAAALQRWFPHPGKPHFATVLAAGSQEELARLVADMTQPVIARATAAGLLRDPGPALRDPDPWVRRAAAAALPAGHPSYEKLLEDPVRAVRVEAGRGLAGQDVQALREYLEVQRYNADQPESHLNVGLVRLAEGQPGQAEEAYGKALQLDPTFVPGYANLADLLRETGQDGRSEAVLRDGLTRVHRAERAPLLYSLGLLQVRQKRLPEAVRSLAEAFRLAPAHPRIGLAYALTLEATGRVPAAVRVLDQVLREHPYDPDSLATRKRLSR